MDVLITRDAGALKRLSLLVNELDGAHAALGVAQERLAKLEELAAEKEAAVARLNASKVKVEAAPNRVDALLRGEAAPSPDQLAAARESRQRNAEIEDQIEAETADLAAINSAIPGAKRDIERAESAVTTARDTLVDSIGEVMVNETIHALAAVMRERIWPLWNIYDLCGDQKAVGPVVRLIAGNHLHFVDRYVSRTTAREAEAAMAAWNRKNEQYEQAQRRLRLEEEGTVARELDAAVQDMESRGKPVYSQQRQELEASIRSRVVAQRKPFGEPPGPQPKNPMSGPRTEQSLCFLAGLSVSDRDPQGMLAAMIGSIRAAAASAEET